MTFEEFSAYWRNQEAIFGNRMIAYMYEGQPAIGARGPLTDEELHAMFEAQESELITGVAHFGTILAGPNVLDFTVR